MPYKCTACEKSFRYKVSQRTHKCTAQPPGTVIRQGDLVQKLIKQNGPSIDVPTNQSFHLTSANSNQNLNIVNSSLTDSHAIRHHHLDQYDNGHTNYELGSEHSNALTNENDFIHSDQTLDDFVEESCKKLGLEIDNVIDHQSTISNNTTNNIISTLDDIQIPSPTEQFQNLCLYSPSNGPIITRTPIVQPTTTSVDNLFVQTLETINEDSFKQLLYGNIDDLNTLI